MPKATQILEFLQSWYRSQCNGEWEHVKGITIETLDIPGWMVTIDLSETTLEGVPMELIKTEQSSTDWLECRIENGQFRATGDSSKLVAILEVFHDWASRTQRVE